MFSDYGEAPSGDGHLYDVVATPTGVRLSACSERGHALVVDLMQRLGLFADARLPAVQTVPDIAATTTVAAYDAAPSSLPNNDLSASAPSTATLPTPSEPQLRLSELIGRHIKNLNRGGVKERSAVRERRYILDLLMQTIGDKPVGDITEDDAEDFADLLTGWPAYRHNQADFAHMSVRSIVARAEEQELPTIQKSTQAKHIKAINAFFAWCVHAELIPHNPFRLIPLQRYREPMPRKKEPFSVDDIKALFHPDRMLSHDAPHKFWVPLIALYTGMRVNEISQLYLEDIKLEHVRDDAGVDHTILCFEVTPHRKHQRLKSAYSQRRIPVHSALLRLGFEQYVDEIRQSGADHLFPGLKWAGDGPGRATTMWFNGRHLREVCGIRNPLKTLHCFRHTINTLASRCRIPEPIMHTINGHSDGQGVRARSYVARGTLLECQRALEELPFPELDVAPYRPGQFYGYLRYLQTEKEHRDRQTKEGKAVSRRRGRPPKYDRPTIGAFPS